MLNDIWHPWWRAAIDGVDTEILKANVLFRAVQVPAGTHKVTFSFNPVEGALAQMRDLVDPPVEEDVPPPAPAAPAVAEDAPAFRPALATPSRDTLESLRLGAEPPPPTDRPQVSSKIGPSSRRD